jgi:hypothetical protein
LLAIINGLGKAAPHIAPDDALVNKIAEMVVEKMKNELGRLP